MKNFWWVRSILLFIWAYNSSSHDLERIQKKRVSYLLLKPLNLFLFFSLFDVTLHSQWLQRHLHGLLQVKLGLLQDFLLKKQRTLYYLLNSVVLIAPIQLERWNLMVKKWMQWSEISRSESPSHHFFPLIFWEICKSSVCSSVF